MTHKPITRADVLLHNLQESSMREQPSAYDTIARVHDMLEAGITKQQIAASCCMHIVTVNQHDRIWQALESLTSQAKETKNSWPAFLVQVVVERLKRTRPDPTAITFSHLRELSVLVLASRERYYPIKLFLFTALIGDLLGLKTGRAESVNTEQVKKDLLTAPTMGFTAWQSLCRRTLAANKR